MALTYQGTEGTLIIPGAYSSIKVQTDNSGLAATGVLMIIGEADAGPDYSLEEDLESNAFGPDQVSAVVSKYRSGPIVDAFRAAAQPANDPSIQGAPNRIVIVKTNDSEKALLELKRWDATTYNYLADKSYGKLGNLIYASVEAKSSEIVPTTGLFTWIPTVGTVAYEIRVDGAAAVGGTLSAAASPASVQSTIDGLSGVTTAGGAIRAIAATTGNASLTIVSGNSVRVDVTVALAVTPSAGDTLFIPDTSVIAGGSDQNVGGYVVTSSTSTQIFATKLSDAGKTGAVAGTITAPIAVVSTPLSGVSNDDLQVYAPLSISHDAGDPVDGIGKSLELAQMTSGTDLLERAAYQLNTTPVTWVSKSSGAKLLSSASEYVAKLLVNRQVDGVQEELSAGGEIAMKIGYDGTSATITITDTALDITVVGGAGANISLDLKDYPTLNDLATFINSRAGFSCAVGNGILGQLPSAALDDVSAAGICTTHGAQVGRLKVDGYKFFKKLSDEGVLTQLQNSSGDVEKASKGLPAPAAVAYLAGGTKGSTTAANVVSAIDALEKIRGNFVIPLFSRDASEDIADGLTESGSTYTIDAINSYCRSHVLKMSTLKRRRNRQAFLSKQSSFADAKDAASNIASFRCTMVFQDAKNIASDGTIKQFQPWMSAVIAAGMQAAGFYRGIVHKGANISGALQAAKDFDDRDDSQMEDALLAGLLPLRRAETGGFIWVSDQTTYGKDSNFVYNSVQATYVADICALSTAQRMESAFVGESVADVSAGLALAFLDSVMKDFMRLKLIAPSDDAPLGYKNAVIRINGPAMVVSLEIKLAGLIYFIPISFVVSQVSQTASA